MRNNELQVIRNDELYMNPNPKKETSKKKIYFRNFLIFIVLALSIFGGIFFIKDKFTNYKNMEENLNFQKQKIMEERMIMEKTLKEENEKLYNLQAEYQDKNEELTNKLNEIKAKEEKLNSELQRIEELKNLLKDQLVEIYKLNVDKMYDSTDGTSSEGNLELDKGLTTEDTTKDPIHTGIILGDESIDKSSEVSDEKILGIANADWFVKLKSLGEFSY